MSLSLPVKARILSPRAGYHCHGSPRSFPLPNSCLSTFSKHRKPDLCTHFQMGSPQYCTLWHVQDISLILMMPPRGVFFSWVHYICSYFTLSRRSQDFFLLPVNNLIAEMFGPRWVSDPVYATANPIPHLLVPSTISSVPSSEIFQPPLVPAMLPTPPAATIQPIVLSDSSFGQRMSSQK